MMGFLTSFIPAFILIAAGVLAASVPASFKPSSIVRKILLVSAPILALILISKIFYGQSDNVFLGGEMTIAGITLTTLRIDMLSLVWGYIFCVAGVINGIFALHEKCKITDSSALIYTGAGLGAVFAGDLITLFMFWELLALSSVFIVWRGGEMERATWARWV